MLTDKHTLTTTHVGYTYLQGPSLITSIHLPLTISTTCLKLGLSDDEKQISLYLLTELRQQIPITSIINAPVNHFIN